MKSLYQSTISSLPLLGRGKVRDNYAVGDDKILIVTTDRLSAFDVVMNEPIPGKGMVLNQMSDFWFDKLGHIVPNHLTGIAPESRGGGRGSGAGQGPRRGRQAPQADPGRGGGARLHHRLGLEGLPGHRRGLRHPAAGRPAPGRQAAEPLFTPAAKADLGEHDENISFAEMEKRIGAELAAKMRDISIQLYTGRRRIRGHARHHHRRHQVRIRPGRQRRAAPDGRSADRRFLALLAGGSLRSRACRRRPSTSSSCATTWKR